MLFNPLVNVRGQIRLAHYQCQGMTLRPMPKCAIEFTAPSMLRFHQNYSSGDQSDCRTDWIGLPPHVP